MAYESAKQIHILSIEKSIYFHCASSSALHVPSWGTLAGESVNMIKIVSGVKWHKIDQKILIQGSPHPPALEHEKIGRATNKIACPKSTHTFLCS